MAHGRGGNIKMFSGNSNRELAEAIAKKLYCGVSPAEVRKFANGETGVSIQCSVRDEDVFIVQSGYGECAVNDSCMELLIMANTMKIASAGRIVAVIPYFPYSKQSKQKKRGAIPSKLMATLLKVAGITQVLTMDLHHMQMQGFFDIPIDNVKASPLIIDYIRSEIQNYKSCVVVAKNAGASKRAALIAKRLKLDFAMIFGEQTKFAECLSEEFLVEGDGSLEAPEGAGDGATAAVAQGAGGNDAAAPPEMAAAAAAAAGAANMGPSTGVAPTPAPAAAAPPNQAERITELADESSYGSSLIGNVDGRHCLLVDDTIDTSSPFVRAADLLMSCNATKVTVICTHGVLSGEAPEELAASCIDKVVVTNTCPQEDKMRRCNKIVMIDCSYVFAECIRRVHNDESVLSLYSNSGSK